MLLTLPHELSAADSAKAHEFAEKIIQDASRLDRMALARHGMNLFQRCPSEMGLVLEAAHIIINFPGVGDYTLPFMSDYHRCTAFEDEVALQVHFLMIRRGKKPVMLNEVIK